MSRAALPKVSDERLREHLAKCLLALSAVLLISLGIVARSSVAAGWGAMMAGLLVLLRLAADVQSGVTSSNWGTWQRREQRVGFYRNVVFWGVVTTFWFVVGILLMLGLIPMPRV